LHLNVIPKLGPTRLRHQWIIATPPRGRGWYSDSRAPRLRVRSPTGAGRLCARAIGVPGARDPPDDPKVSCASVRTKDGGPWSVSA
jgi:hypothetical protein